MAMIGEMAGKTAPEILNPITAINSKLEKKNDISTTKTEYLDIFTQTISAWMKNKLETQPIK